MRLQPVADPGIVRGGGPIGALLSWWFLLSNLIICTKCYWRHEMLVTWLHAALLSVCPISVHPLALGLWLQLSILNWRPSLITMSAAVLPILWVLWWVCHDGILALRRPITRGAFFFDSLRENTWRYWTRGHVTCLDIPLINFKLRLIAVLINRNIVNLDFARAQHATTKWHQTCTAPRVLWFTVCGNIAYIILLRYITVHLSLYSTSIHHWCASAFIARQHRHIYTHTHTHIHTRQLLIPISHSYTYSSPHLYL